MPLVDSITEIFSWKFDTAEVNWKILTRARFELAPWVDFGNLRLSWKKICSCISEDDSEIGSVMFSILFFFYLADDEAVTVLLSHPIISLFLQGLLFCRWTDVHKRERKLKKDIRGMHQRVVREGGWVGGGRWWKGEQEQVMKKEKEGTKDPTNQPINKRTSA